MTRADLADWVMQHGCQVAEFPDVNNTASVVRFRNPSTNGRAYLDCPFDERPVKDYTVYRICTLLGIKIPDHVKYLNDLYDHIERNHN